MRCGRIAAGRRGRCSRCVGRVVLPVFFLVGLVLSACATADVGPINTHVAEAGRPSPEFVPDPVRRRLDRRRRRLLGRRHARVGLRLRRAARPRRGRRRPPSETAHGRRRYPHDLGRLGRRCARRLFRPPGQAAMSTCANASCCRTPRRSFTFEAFAGQSDPRLRRRRQRPFDLRRLARPKTSSTARPTPRCAARTRRSSGSTHPTSTTARRSISPTTHSLRSAAISTRSGSPTRSPRLPPFPVVFKPLVVSTAATATKCNYRQPEWLTRALADPAASVRLKAYARSLETYQNDPGCRLHQAARRRPDRQYRRHRHSRWSAPPRRRPTVPLSAAEAVKLHNFVFIVVDSSVETEGDWVKTLNGPKLRKHGQRRLQRRHPLLGPRRVRRAEPFRSSSGAAS